MFVRSLLLVGALVAISSAALAKEPCDQLTGDAAKQYNSLGEVAAERYGNEDFSGAIEAILQLKEICDEDPRLDYNLARSYHRAENCNMARFWYEEVNSRSEEELGDELLQIIQKQKKKALASITELEQICANSSRVNVTCADDGVTLDLGDGVLTGECPIASRIDAGNYTLTASKEGYESVTIDVPLKAGQSASLYIPALKLYVPEATTGTLRVRCDEGVTEVLASVEGQPDATFPCPGEQELPPGVYTLRVPELDLEETVNVERGQTANVRLGVQTRVIEGDTVFILADEDLRLGAWVSIGTGFALLAGGLALHLVALDMFTDLTDPENTGFINGAPSVVTSITQKDAMDTAETVELLDTIGWISAGVGGAAIITGIILLVASEPDEEPPAEVGASFTRDGGVLIHVGGRF